jgi:hypothetical protein
VLLAQGTSQFPLEGGVATAGGNHCVSPRRSSPVHCPLKAETLVRALLGHQHVPSMVPCLVTTSGGGSMHDRRARTSARPSSYLLRLCCGAAAGNQNGHHHDVIHRPHRGTGRRAVPRATPGFCHRASRHSATQPASQAGRRRFDSGRPPLMVHRSVARRATRVQPSPRSLARPPNT